MNKFINKYTKLWVPKHGQYVLYSKTNSIGKVNLSRLHKDNKYVYVDFPLKGTDEMIVKSCKKDLLQVIQTIPS